MPQPPAPGDVPAAGPRFYVTPRSRFSPGPFFLALVIASGMLLAMIHAQRRLTPAGASAGDDDDDTSQMDTIYLGDPGQAPVPSRPGGRPSSVHPFVVVHLPRSGSQFGQIPNTDAGRLLYAWLAAFNAKDPSDAAKALPVPWFAAAEAAQVDLRKATGGFSLISAREVQPGLLVFRLQDQTAGANEALGTLQVRPDATPPAIESFSLRAVPHPSPKAP